MARERIQGRISHAVADRHLGLVIRVTPMNDQPPAVTHEPRHVRRNRVRVAARDPWVSLDADALLVHGWTAIGFAPTDALGDPQVKQRSSATSGASVLSRAHRHAQREMSSAGCRRKRYARRSDAQKSPPPCDELEATGPHLHASPVGGMHDLATASRNGSHCGIRIRMY